MDCAVAKRCLTEQGFLMTQRNVITDSDLHFLYCASITALFLKKNYGVRYYKTYVIALCREGIPLVAFLDGPVISLAKFFNRPSDEGKRVSINRILELDHCAHGMHVPSKPDGPPSAFDVTVWVRSSLETLAKFFAVKKEKVPGKVAVLQYKRGLLPEKYQYNMTCSLAMIIGLAIDVYEKLPTDICNRCGKGRNGEKLDAKLFKCQRCLTARYCGRVCQVEDWRDGHADECHNFKVWASEGVKMRGDYVTVDTAIHDTTEAVDKVLDRLKASDPERYRNVTFLV